MALWLPFKDEKLVLLLFVHDQILSSDYTQPFLIWRLLNTNNLIWLSAVGHEERNGNTLDFPEILGAVNINTTDIGDKDAIHTFDLNRFRTLHVERIDTYSQVMKVFPLVDFE